MLEYGPLIRWRGKKIISLPIFDALDIPIADGHRKLAHDADLYGTAILVVKKIDSLRPD